MDAILASISDTRNVDNSKFHFQPSWVNISDNFHSNRDQISSTTQQRAKQALYMPDEEIDASNISFIADYALLIRHGGENRINGYYTVAGKKNGYFLFSHQRDPKAAVFREKNGTWMIIYDNELLYSNALESDGHGGINVLNISEKDFYPPPLRCWNAVSGINPPPGCMFIHLTEEPLAVLNNPFMKNGNSKELVNKSIEDDAPELERDLPCQTMEFTFVGNMGFALRIDNEYNKMEVIRIKPNGQAMEVGLQHGDMLLRINEENVSNSPEIAFPMLKECVDSGQPFVVTFLRKMFDKLVVMVTRAGTSDANGKYLYDGLDDQDAPVFVKSNDKDWVLARLDYDDESGESIWSLQKNGNDYYIGLSADYSPPNGGWECVKPMTKKEREKEKEKERKESKDNNEEDENDESETEEIDANYKGGMMPAPGLQYFIKTMPMVKKLIDDNVEKELKQHHMTMEHRQRRRNLTKKMGDTSATIEESENDDSGDSGSDDSENENENENDSNDDSNDESNVNSISEKIKEMNKMTEERRKEYENTLSSKMEEINHLQRRETVLKVEHESELDEYKDRLSKLKDNLHDCNYYYFDLWMTQWNQNIENDSLINEIKQLKTKFNLVKKQLFQSKREIDDLNENIMKQNEIIESFNRKEHVRKKTQLLSGKELKDINENESAINKSENILFASMVENESKEANKDFFILELQTEIIDLKTKLASKDIKIEELSNDNMKWQDAHDSIFEQMTEIQKRLSDESAIFEDSKNYYTKKYNQFNDRIQENEIEIYELNKRISQLEFEYKKETNKNAPKWVRENEMPQHKKALTLTVNNNNNDDANSNNSNRRQMSNMSTNSFATITSMDIQEKEILSQMKEETERFGIEESEYFDEQDASNAFVDSPFGMASNVEQDKDESESDSSNEDDNKNDIHNDDELMKSKEKDLIDNGEHHSASSGSGTHSHSGNDVVTATVEYDFINQEKLELYDKIARLEANSNEKEKCILKLTNVIDSLTNDNKQLKSYNQMLSKENGNLNSSNVEIVKEKNDLSQECKMLVNQLNQANEMIENVVLSKLTLVRASCREIDRLTQVINNLK